MVKAILFDCIGVLYVPRRLGFSRKLVLNEVLLEYSQSLRSKYKVAMFTNLGPASVDKYFTQSQLEEWFDNIVISGEVGAAKPQTEVYELAAKIVGQEPKECVLIDDSELNCQGAKLAGMRAVLYRSNDQAQNDLAALLM